MKPSGDLSASVRLVLSGQLDATGRNNKPFRSDCFFAKKLFDIDLIQNII